jgi:uncharacterized protein (TIGR02246 family)
MQNGLMSVCVLLALTVALGAQAAKPDHQALATEYESAFNKGDTKSLMALYTAEPIRVTLQGQLLEGRDAITQDYTSAFAGPLKGAKLTLRAGGTRMLTADTAVIDGTLETSGTSTPLKGRYVNTIVRQGGRWLLASVVALPQQPTATK